MNYQPDNWVDFLQITEFETYLDLNNSSGIASFLATKRYHPRSSLESPILSKKSLLLLAKKKIKAADRFIEKIKQLRKHLQVELR